MTKKNSGVFDNFRRKITGSIKNKLLLMFLIATIIPMAVSFLVTESVMFSMKEKSEKLLVDEALVSATTFTQEEAMKIDNQLEGVIDTIYANRDYTEYLYANSGSFRKNKVLTPDEFPQSTTGRTIHWLPCSEDADTKEVVQEAYLLGNLQPMLDATLNNSEMITSIYITTKTGINLGYDENVLSKQGLGYFETREGRDWYTIPKETGEIYISDTYVDVFGRGLMVTIAVPYMVNGEFQGVIGADINIENINKAILDISVGDDGRAMMFSKDGMVISAQGLTEGSSIDPKDYLGDNYKAVVAGMLRNNSNYATSNINGSDVYIIYSKISITNWKLAVILPVEQIIEPAQESNKYIITTNIFLIAVFVLVTVIMMVYVGKSCNKISYPVIHLTESMKKIESGNLNYVSDIYTQDEIQTLSKGFESMTQSLKEYINNLTSVTAEKERIGAELNVATQIQADMLPRIFPAFPEHKEFDVYASMNPAKEVGGDFYDFFMVDEDHLAVVMADVSGKGVPAALFMVVAKTLIKNQTMNGLQPGDVFSTVNSQLCEGNDTGLFVTAWMGILEVSTGRFTYANAGHNSPLLKRNGQEYEWLVSKPGFVLAGMEGMKYTQNETMLNAGDKLFLYTDGVTEALNQEKELFSDARLKRTLNDRNLISLNVTQLLRTVKMYVTSFTDGAEQADDITMLGLEYRGCEQAAEVKEEKKEEKTEIEEKPADTVAEVQEQMEKVEELTSEVQQQAREMRTQAAEDRAGARDMKNEAQEMRAMAQGMRARVAEITGKPIQWDYSETLVAEVDNLEHVIAQSESILAEMGASDKIIMSMSVTIEEIFVNITNYAYAPNNGAVHIAMKKDMDSKTFIMCFTDHGVAYNPLEKQDPDITLSADDREIGGLGIFMVKKNVDDITYERVGDKNILTFWKRIE